MKNSGKTYLSYKTSPLFFYRQLNFHYEHAQWITIDYLCPAGIFFSITIKPFPIIHFHILYYVLKEIITTSRFKYA